MSNSMSSLSTVSPVLHLNNQMVDLVDWARESSPVTPPPVTLDQLRKGICDVVSDIFPSHTIDPMPTQKRFFEVVLAAQACLTLLTDLKLIQEIHPDHAQRLGDLQLKQTKRAAKDGFEDLQRLHNQSVIMPKGHLICTRGSQIPGTETVSYHANIRDWRGVFSPEYAEA